MLRGAEKWITNIILVIIFLFGVLFLLKQMTLMADLRSALDQSRRAADDLGSLNNIVQLHTTSAKIFFLSFFAFCLLLIGIVVVMQNIQRAYHLSEVRQKVRMHLRNSTPGIVMIVIGTFLLAFCSFRVSHVETVYNAKLLGFNKENLALRRMNTVPAPLVVIDDGQEHKNSEDSLETETAAPQEPVKQVKQSKVVNSTQRGKTEQNSKRQHQTAAQSSSRMNNSAHTEPKQQQPPVQKPPTQITPSDLKWANEFQRKVTIYGYIPSDAEAQRYEAILRYNEKHPTSLNEELQWAYLFLQKTKRGYQPKAKELQHYETVIQRNLSTSASQGSVHPEL